MASKTSSKAHRINRLLQVWQAPELSMQAIGSSNLLDVRISRERITRLCHTISA